MLETAQEALSSGFSSVSVHVWALMLKQVNTTHWSHVTLKRECSVIWKWVVTNTHTHINYYCSIGLWNRSRLCRVSKSSTRNWEHANFLSATAHTFFSSPFTNLISLSCSQSGIAMIWQMQSFLSTLCKQMFDLFVTYPAPSSRLVWGSTSGVNECIVLSSLEQRRSYRRCGDVLHEIVNYFNRFLETHVIHVACVKVTGQ